jgi:glycosyltransferase involved in cell wall biosynthesis
MISGVLDPRSTGIRAYAERLRDSLAPAGVDYSLSWRPLPSAPAHFHLGNSTRSLLPDLIRQRDPLAVTLHDVLPRMRALRLPHRALLLPVVLARAGCVIVHSAHAADLLSRSSIGPTARRIEVIPHAATTPREPSRALARDALAADLRQDLEPSGPPLFVLPGTLKRAKLVAETLAAARPLIAAGRMRLLLAGAAPEPWLVEAAQRSGAALLRSPDHDSYERAIVAADVVLCARADSVGETNGPLLDAIGAGRPAVITAVGSAPEIAQDSAVVVEPTAKGLRQGISALLDPDERRERAAHAQTLAGRFSSERVAARHAELFRSLGWA